MLLKKIANIANIAKNIVKIFLVDCSFY